MINKKKLDKLSSVYIVFFCVYLIMNNVFAYVNTDYVLIKNIISFIFMLCGCICMVGNVIENKRNLLKNYSYILWIYIMVCIASSISMIKFGYINNLKTIIWSCILFGVIYTYFIDKNQENSILYVKKIIISISMVFGITIAISIFQYIFNIGYEVVLKSINQGKAQGFWNGRLWGIYVEPNFAAVTAAIISLFSYYFFKQADNKIEKCNWIINIILQLSFIVLSNSRSGLVTFFMGYFCYVFLNLLKKYDKINLKNILRFFSSMIIYFLCVGILLYGIRIVFSNIPIIEISTLKSNTDEIIETDDKVDKSRSLKRTDLEGKDISNMRFQIWMDCLKISKSKILLGTSPRNIVEYAKQYAPNTYTASGFDFGNGYVAVLAGTGIIGTIVIICFIYKCLKNIILFIFTKRYLNCKYYEFNILGLSIIFAIAIDCAINHEIFLINTANTAIFWLMLGWIMNEINSNKEKKIDGEK